MPGIIPPSGDFGKHGSKSQPLRVSRGWTYFGDPVGKEISDILAEAKAAAANADVLATWDDYRAALGDSLPARLTHANLMRARIRQAVR